MIRINNISLPLNYDNSTIEKRICNELRINKNAIEKFSLLKRSVDARKKNDIKFNATVEVFLNTNEKNAISKSKSKKSTITEVYRYDLPDNKKFSKTPVIVGFGPAGMFCGLILARCGANPIIIEQGQDVDTRIKDIEEFYKTGVLNSSSNIQFGEGGAGTFSDGKLNTGINDIRSRMILNEFVNHGAPEEILYNAKPHIGTDYLRKVVKNIRQEIISLGGEIKFGARFVDFEIKNNRVHSIAIESGNNKEKIETEDLVLAIGHSSRDTFEMLWNKKIMLQQKAFSVGVRIEHLREKIDKSQYGDFYNNSRLGSAPYKLATHLDDGRGVYTFCMCPGGEVVAAASEENMICTNGMSEFARDKVNSNSALLVGVNPEDFKSEHPLAGIEFQRNIEKTAFKLNDKYIAPVQKVGDFINNIKSTSFGEVLPSYSRGTAFGCLNDYLPEFVTDSIRQALPQLDRKLKGFADYDAILTGPETRSSSPVRILRNENFQSVSVIGIYPCGEGAGYAGGIISTAVDGVKCAEKILYTSE